MEKFSFSSQAFVGLIKNPITPVRHIAINRTTGSPHPSYTCVEVEALAVVIFSGGPKVPFK